MTAPPLVTIDGVTRRFGAVTALDAVSLTLEAGVTGLLGPNGAGKTTLIRALATVEPPDAGSIHVLGDEATGPLAARTRVRRVIGYLPQELAFPRGMTAFTFLDYIAVLKEWSDTAARHAEVRRVLDLVDLGGRASARVRTLSGGQRRRLALGQAFIGDPDLLILDEPTTGLDPERRASLRAVLSARGAVGAVLLSTHQTEDVAALCERVVVLAEGRVRFDGTVSDFVGAAAGSVWLADREVPGAAVSWRTGTGRIRSIGGHPGPDAVPAEPSVEDAYLLMVGRRAADRVAVAA
ncbi:ATP-binding cassette domain-containing protein [Miltoncostaea oceani]|uniref:ATP-binding cassette domain-containing protein n=1 Tax=Miltoncostaea oceani TaxID=2843216 RepID=UPI001C3DC6E1|nr:ATP-binding cassette domain-containing protein [Miltoncostaea oceani]